MISPLALLVIWQALSELGWVSSQILPAPSAILSDAAQLIASGELPHHLWVSVQRALLGLLIGVMVGVALALISGLSRLGEEAVDAPMQMLRTVPVVALVPLYIVWFGIGEQAKVLLIATACIFPIYLNTYSGIRGVDRRLLEAGKTLNLGRLGTIRDIVLPGALPSFLVGLRFTAGVSILMLVVAEQVNASSGIGYLMTQATNSYNTELIMVGLLTYSLLGLATDIVVRLVEARALAWRPSMIDEAT